MDSLTQELQLTRGGTAIIENTEASSIQNIVKKEEEVPEQPAIMEVKSFLAIRLIPVGIESLPLRVG